MSAASLEREILAKAKIAFKNPKLRLKDIREWSSGTIKVLAGEVTIRLDTGINVCILKVNDKRKG